MEGNSLSSDNPILGSGGIGLPGVGLFLGEGANPIVESRILDVFGWILFSSPGWIAVLVWFLVYR